MSSMEFFIGTFKRSDINVDPEDTDDFYDLEQQHGGYYVKVDGVLYQFESILDVDRMGSNQLFPNPLLTITW